MRNEVNPIFLLSLPRSGSTLVQRVISAHSEIATTAEPWILLPLYSALEQNLCKAKYGHKFLFEATKDLCNRLPGGSNDYHAAVRAFAEVMYSAIAGQHGAQFFLDKTPRYHLIARHLLEGFPNAKIIIIWRNPLSMIGSQIQSYGGVWRIQYFHVDLFDGLANLVQLCESHAEKICVIRFEDMVRQPESLFGQIFDYIGLHFNSDVLSSFTEVTVNGRMGDKTGLREYNSISREPLQKWRKTLRSPIRKLWIRHYLRWIGERRLRIMGYDQYELLSQLASVPTSCRTVPSDLIRLAYSGSKLWRHSVMF